MVAKIGSIVIATTVIVVMCGVSRAAAKSKHYKATCAGSYTGDPNLSYDGEVNLAVGNLSGYDNIEGNFVAQDYAEDNLIAEDNLRTCTAPDGTAGTNYPLVGDIQINTYTSADQMYMSFSTGNDCLSNTTPSFGGAQDGTVTGGTGKLAKASGPIHETYVGVFVSLPASPGFGYIVTVQVTITGTVKTR
jgi:hypothetical protein